MNKKGFTLIEVIISIVLVSIVMVSLLGSLIQLRQTYTLIHEDSDIIVYTSSISRVINNDLALNNGIRYATCSADGKKCDIILGNDQKRSLEIIKKCYVDGSLVNCNNEYEEKKEIIKTTLKYVNTTKPTNTSLIYIRTLELSKYLRKGKVSSSGFNFADISTNFYEHDIDASKSKVDQYTIITIKLNNEINEDISKYDIKLYTAGRYDYEHLVGKTFTLELNSNGAQVAGTTKIDEVFGVGFFETESNHTVSNQLNASKRIIVPQNSDKAFLGYFYRPAGSSQSIQVIDSRGIVIASSRFFKEEVNFNLENDPNKPIIIAQWADCVNGYKIEDGKCKPETYNIVLNGGETQKTLSVIYNSKVPNNDFIPYKAGFKFDGFFYAGKRYINASGKGTRIYDIPNSDGFVFEASYLDCNKTNVQEWKKDNNCNIESCEEGYKLESNNCIPN